MFMRLTVLGCNGPYPAPEGACSGYLVEAEGAALQLDLGSGVLARLTGRMPPEELTALLRELVTLEERTDKGPETVKVVLAKEAEEWSR